MAEGAYSERVRPGKSLTTGDMIAPGAIELSHLSSALFSEIRQIALHTHSGVKSRKIQYQDLEGSFTQNGFYMRSPNGSKWQIRIDNSGTITSTAV